MKQVLKAPNLQGFALYSVLFFSISNFGGLGLDSMSCITVCSGANARELALEE